MLRLLGHDRAGEALDAVVAGGEAEAVDQALVDRGVIAAQAQLLGDEGAVRLARRGRLGRRSRWPGWGNLNGRAGGPLGEFEMPPSTRWTRLRMVLRSTRVMRAISRWLLPAASRVRTVVCRCGFKTFTPNFLDDRRRKITSCQRDASVGRRRRFTAPLYGQRVGEFGVARGGGI